MAVRYYRHSKWCAEITWSAVPFEFITGLGRQAESGEIPPVGGLVRVCRDWGKSTQEKRSTVEDTT